MDLNEVTWKFYHSERFFNLLPHEVWEKLKLKEIIILVFFFQLNYYFDIVWINDICDETKNKK